MAKDVFSTVPENFDAFQAEQDQVIDAHDHVVVIGRFRGKAKSGAALDVPYVHVWAMRNGKAVSFHNYVDAAGWAKGWGG